MIAIIDGCGTNINSILYALNRLGVEATLTRCPKEIDKASHVILPGVGHATHAMRQLNDYQLISVIKQLTKPLLGICLGMQLLFTHSEEGNTDCLDIIPGDVCAFTDKPNRSIPHMGWNSIDQMNDSSFDTGYVYFAHSYYVPIIDYTKAASQYPEKFSAIVNKDNFYGMQFHPERSGDLGERLLQQFLQV